MSKLIFFAVAAGCAFAAPAFAQTSTGTPQTITPTPSDRTTTSPAPPAGSPTLSQTTPGTGGSTVQTMPPAGTGTGGSTVQTMPPAGTGTGGSSAGATTMPTMTGGFLASQSATQWLASDLMDRSVYGSDGSSIGDINDLILDQNGQIAAVVVGVGGFLGIGEKDVAVPFQQFERATRAMSGSGTAGGVAGNAGGTNDRLILRSTKADLESAPTFRSMAQSGAARDNTGTVNTTPGTTGTTGTTLGGSGAGGTTGVPSTTR